MSLACEDAILTFHEAVIVADVDAEKYVDDILGQNWKLVTKLKFGQYFANVMELNLGRDSEARFGQEFEV